MTAETDVRPSPSASAATRLAGLGSAVRTLAGSRGWRTGGLGVAAAALAMPMLAACASSPAHADADGATISAVCNALGAALADGPDPDADPVGYAEAQIGPLGAIQTSEHALEAAIRDLAAAYAQVFASAGTSAAASKAVTAATGKVTAICPGVAS
ncbi:MAG: hypothetical protein WBH47_22540 [Streptosporangiaceae bacterium]